MKGSPPTDHRLLVGTSIFVSRVGFYASNNIEPGANLSLPNERKAPAGFVLAAGLCMLGGICVRGMADTALWLAALIHLSCAGSRLLSMAFDGVPAIGLVQAAALEGIVGLACLTVSMMRRLPARRVA